MNRPRPTGVRHEEHERKAPYRQKIHAPNGMQMTELNETPKMKCNKRDFDL